MVVLIVMMVVGILALMVCTQVSHQSNKQVLQVRARVEELEAVLDDSNRRKLELEGQVYDLQQRLEHSEQDVDHLRSDLQESYSLNRMKDSNFQTTIDENLSIWKAEKLQLESTIKRLTNEKQLALDEHSVASDSWQKQKEDYCSKLVEIKVALDKEISSFNEELSKLKAQVSIQKIHLQQALDDTNHYRDMWQQARMDASHNEELLKLSQARETELTEKIHALNVERDGLQCEVDKLNAERANLQMDLDNLHHLEFERSAAVSRLSSVMSKFQGIWSELDKGIPQGLDKIFDIDSYDGHYCVEACSCDSDTTELELELLIEDDDKEPAITLVSCIVCAGSGRIYSDAPDYSPHEESEICDASIVCYACGGSGLVESDLEIPPSCSC